MNKRLLILVIILLILLIILITMGIFSFLNKNKQQGGGNVPGGFIGIPMGQSKGILGGVVTIVFEDVKEDSRCPSDVNCVWSGMAIIEVALSSANNKVVDGHAQPIPVYELSIPGGNPKYYHENCTSEGKNCSNITEIPGTDFALVFAKLDLYPVSKKEIKKSSYTAYFFLKQLKSEWETITLPVEARGDEVNPGPITAECQSRMNEYMKSKEFKDKGFSICKLLESKVGTTDKECPNGFSAQGCSICKIMCR